MVITLIMADRNKVAAEALRGRVYLFFIVYGNTIQAQCTALILRRAPPACPKTTHMQTEVSNTTICFLSLTHPNFHLIK